MGLEVGFAAAFIAGLLSFLSPCVLPLVPPYLGYLGGATFAQLTDEGAVGSDVYKRVVLAAVVFVLGFTTVFVGLGAAASAFGQLIRAYFDYFIMAAGVLIIIFGLHFLRIITIPLLYREARFHPGAQTVGLLGAYVIGLAFAFGWTPCVSPVLSVVLMKAANEAQLGQGMALLFVYSLGLGVPFILAAVAIRPFMGFMARFRRHLGLVEKAMGGLLVVTGILFITGSMNLISNWIMEAFPFLAELG